MQLSGVLNAFSMTLQKGGGEKSRDARDRERKKSGAAMAIQRCPSEPIDPSAPARHGAGADGTSRGSPAPQTMQGPRKKADLGTQMLGICGDGLYSDFRGRSGKRIFINYFPCSGEAIAAISSGTVKDDMEVRGRPSKLGLAMPPIHCAFGQ